MLLEVSLVGYDPVWNVWPDPVAESQCEPLDLWNKAMPPVLEYYTFQEIGFSMLVVLIETNV